ncbi:MAG: autotransporter domain-containing protein [Chlamydiales bacterium]|nr:autotransporter domain-containing protein [Chlamydiales bacterium]
MLNFIFRKLLSDKKLIFQTSRLFSYSFGKWVLSLLAAFPGLCFAESADSIVYVTDSNTNDIYRVDLTTGQSSVAANIPTAGGIQGIALLNSKTAYVGDYFNSEIYRVDLTTGQSSVITTISGANLEAMAIANSTRAYIVSDEGGVYRVNLQTGASAPVVQIPGTPGLAGIALIPDSATAYVCGFNNGTIYHVDLATGQYSDVVTISPNVGGISLINRTTAYVAGGNSSNIYRVDLTTGQYSLVTNISGEALQDIQLANTITPYTISPNNLYFIDPTTGAFSLTSNVANDSGLAYMAFQLQLPTSGLNGNNLTFVNYLNDNASFDTLFSLTLQDNFTAALESASPIRNALSLFALDDNLFSLNHGLSLHLRNQRHFRNRTPYQKQQKSQEVAANTEAPSLLLKLIDEEPQQAYRTETSEDVSLERRTALKKTPLASAECTSLMKDCPYTLWFEGIGAFATQKAQDQTVGFHPKTGGFILAFDGMKTEQSLVGGGFAYTFTHVSEDNDAGSSDINQECFFLYSSWENYGFYLDGALWTAIFQTSQMRNIHLTGVNFVAESHPKGFQLLPHLEFGYDKTRIYSNNHVECIMDPFVMLDCANSWQWGYSEKGSSPFNFGQKAQYSAFLRTEAGFRFYETFFFDTWRLVLEEKGSYVNKTPFGVGRVNAFLVGSPGSFTVETFAFSQNLAVFEMMFIFEPLDSKYPYGSISYQGEFSPSFQSHQATAEFSWTF